MLRTGIITSMTIYDPFPHHDIIFRTLLVMSTCWRRYRAARAVRRRELYREAERVPAATIRPISCPWGVTRLLNGACVCYILNFLVVCLVCFVLKLLRVPGAWTRVRSSNAPPSQTLEIFACTWHDIRDWSDLESLRPSKRSMVRITSSWKLAYFYAPLTR